MPILTMFNLTTMDLKKYNETIRSLEDVGQGKPEGRLYHVAMRKDDGSMIVTDIWESLEMFEAFSKTLIPVLNEVGVTPVEPIVYPVLNVIKD